MIMEHIDNALDVIPLRLEWPAIPVEAEICVNGGDGAAPVTVPAARLFSACVADPDKTL